MKKKVMAFFVGFMLLFSSAVSAKCHRGFARLIFMVGGGAIGYVAGPVGSVIGMAIGDRFNKSISKCKEDDDIAFYEESPEQRVDHLLAHSGNHVTGETDDQFDISPLHHDETAVYFATGSNVLTPEYKTILDDVAAVMKKHPQLRLSVVGGADPRGEKSYDNLALSDRRADTVKKYLESHGVTVTSHRIVAKGIGVIHDSEPYEMRRVARLKIFNLPPHM